MQKIIILLSLLFFHLAQAEIQHSIGIFTYKVQGMNPWDPESIKTGITGSEETVIYMAEKLAKLGNQVTVFADPPKNSPHSLATANPRYVAYDFNDGSHLDIAISWRMPQMAPLLKTRASKVYFWPHDICCFQVAESQINAFDDVLWISNWQREQWISVNPGFAKFTKIFGNGINPEQFNSIKERVNPHSCVYGSNYARGLEILLNIWPSIKHEFPNATLDIYYGWQHWGLLSPQQEAKMRSQIENLKALGVCDHGQVGHEELNQAYERTSLWTYPCIDQETFCITALRAQLSGAFPVIIEGSALKETVRHGLKCFTPEEYTALLKNAMRTAEKLSLQERVDMGKFILKEFTWDALALKWKELFDSTKEDAIPK